MIKTNYEKLYKWDKRFFNLAHEVATWSKDPNCQVGAILISEDKTRISYGFNGLPRGINDSVDRLNDNKIKNLLSVHAELNAIINAQCSVKGWTIYTNKFPCLNCALSLIQAGISFLICPDINPNSKWAENQNLALDILKEKGVYITIITDK